MIVTGRDRTQALERSRRALAEFVVDGMPTVVPFHRAVVDDPAYIGEGSDTDGHFGIYTSWIETEFDNQITPYAGSPAEGADPEERQTVVVEVGGRRLEVSLPGRSRVGRSLRRRPERRRSPSDRPARRPAPRPAVTP